MALATNLVSYWKLDESSGNASDSVGSNTLTNTNTVSYSAGKINNGADTGSGNTNKYLTNATSLGLNTDNTRSFTMAGWINMASFTVGDIDCMFNMTATNQATIWFGPQSSGANLGIVVIGSAVRTYNVAYAFSTSTWYHVASTFSGNTITLYVNGVSIGSTTITEASTYTCTANFSLFRDANDTKYVSGKVDEVGVWSRVLTADEVSQVFNSGRGNAYPLTDSPSLYGSLSYWKLDESSGNAVDTIGLNTLTNNNTATFASAKINNGASTNGTNQYFRKAPTITGLPNTVFSLGGWIRADVTTDAVVACFGLDGSNTGFALQVNGTKFTTEFQIGSGTGKVQSSAISTATWYHVIATCDGTDVVLYVNGSSVGTITRGAGQANTAGAIILGAWVDGSGAVNGNYFDGTLDEIGIWNRALSSTEVTSLYNSGSGKAYPWASTDYPITAGIGAFTLTGVSNNLLFGRNLVASAGSFTLTGIDILFSIGKGIIAEVGSFILTGINVALRYSGWKKESANSATFTNQSQNTSSWTNETK